MTDSRSPIGAVRWRRALACCAAILGVASQARIVAEEFTPGQSSSLAGREPLIVGVTTDSFPYGYKGADGQWTGFSVDLLDAVAARMDLKIRRVAAPGKELQARFKAGEFDLMQALSQTPEREEYADFSVPYLTLQGTVFVQKRDSPIRRLEDLNGRKFAVIGVGSIGERFLADRGLSVQPVYVSSSEDALVLLEKGECAGTFVSHLTALAVIEHSRLRNVTIFGNPFSDYDIRHCYAVHKGDRLLLARLNEGLAILQRDGTYDRIYQKWFGHFVSPMFTREEVIRFGMAALALALIAALWGLDRQRRLRRRIAGQSEELARQQGVLQALYDNVPLAMCVLEGSAEGRRVLSINRQAESLFRAPGREVAGRLLREAATDREWMDLLVDALVHPPSERGLVREERLLAGSKRRLVVTVVPLAPGPEGRERTCVLAEDVTAARALDEEIAQSRRLRAVGELVGGIAHEFNNLLTPVMLKVAEIRMDREDDEKLREDLRPISDAARRAADLTRRLLAFGRKSEASSEEVSVAAVVDGCFSLLRSAIDRRITLSSLVPARLPAVRMNATDLNQVVLNLLLNARDTLVERLTREPDGPAAEIRVEGAFVPPESAPLSTPASELMVDGWVRVSVIDNGMGMPAEVRDRIFEPFFTTKEVGKGSGLGLATVWHLVAQCGGRVEVHSEAGAGSRFDVFVPAAPRSRPAAAPAEVTADLDAPPARVFLGDDDDLVASAMADSIRRAGHSVQRLADGAAIWAHLRDNVAEFDVVILDINMPGLPGTEIARRLRGEVGYRGPIVIVGGRLSPEDRRDLLALPVEEILEKPFETGQLLAALGRALRRAARV